MQEGHSVSGTYSGGNNQEIIGPEGLDHVKLCDCANETRQNGRDEEHQGQDLNQRRLVAVGDDFWRRHFGGKGWTDESIESRGCEGFEKEGLGIRETSKNGKRGMRIVHGAK